MKIKDGVIKKTLCGTCHANCGVKVHVSNGEAVKVEGDRENPQTRGRLCPKAAAALDIHRHPDRLNYPLKRSGERGEGRWERISWEQAMDEIAARIQAIRDKYGPEAVAFMGGCPHEPGDWAAWRWCNLFGTPNIHNQGKNCGEAEFLAECATYGYHTAPEMLIPGVTRCLVLWGTNQASSVPTTGWRGILEIKEKGAKIIVVDPRFTETASKADLWLQLRPGTDAALGLGMLNVIIKENLYDKKFVEEYCLGFDEIKALVEEYPPRKVADITWVPEPKIIEAARSIATLKPSVVTMGVATCHLGPATKSAVQIKSILRALTGLDVEGGNVIKEPFENLAWFENLYWDLLLERPQTRRDSVSADMFPIASVRGYKLWREAMKKVYPKGYGPTMYMMTCSGINLWDAILREKPYPVKAVITQGANPLLTLDARGCYQALKSNNLELHVAMDLFMTPTIMLADYVFPAADWLERPTLSFFWGIVASYSAGEQSVEPLYERRDDYQFWRELGIRLGQEKYWPETLDKMYDRFLEPTGKSFKEIVHQKESWYSPETKYKKYEKKGFATFSGKVELLPSIFAKLGIDPLPRYEEPARSPIRTPDLAREYPLILISGSRIVYYQHSCYRQQEKLRKAYPDPLLQIHPDTASKLGIANGNWVYIETPEGRIKQKAKLTEGIDPRVVHADGYWWFPESPAEEPSLFGVWDSNINALVPVDPELYDYAGDYPFRAVLCKVYKE